MMRLYMLGSGSGGNCCAVEADGAAILLDTGFSAREIERRAASVGLDLTRVRAIALTHEHGDHACGAPRLARRLGVPVLTAAGTWDRLQAGMGSAAHQPVGLRATVELGSFRLGPIDLEVAWQDRLAIVGPNGSGKTTLLRALLGEIDLTSGQRWLGPGVKVGLLDQRRLRYGGDDALLPSFMATWNSMPCPGTRTGRVFTWPSTSPASLRMITSRAGACSALARQSQPNAMVRTPTASTTASHRRR
jgi:hypothetical protein